MMMKVAIPGRAMKMDEHHQNEPHLNPILKPAKIPFNNIEIRPPIDYLNLQTAGGAEGNGGAHGFDASLLPLTGTTTTTTTNSNNNSNSNIGINTKGWKKTARLYRKELKAKGNMRPSTAVRRHVKRISEEFTLTQVKYENSVTTTDASRDKNQTTAPPQPTTTTTTTPSLPPTTTIPGTGTKIGRNANFKITCTKCESTSRAAPKSVMTPIVTSMTTTNTTPCKTKFHHTRSKSGPPRDNGSPIKKVPSCLTPPTRPKVSGVGRCGLGPGGGGGGGGECSSLAPPTSPAPLQRSPGTRRTSTSSSLTGVSPRSKQMSFEQIKKVKMFTEKAILEGRVFSIFGYFPAIKDALRRRGWVEKMQHNIPYLNPHPNNCVCPHVGYQASFLSPSHTHSHHYPNHANTTLAQQSTLSQQGKPGGGAEEEEEEEEEEVVVRDCRNSQEIKDSSQTSRQDNSNQVDTQKQTQGNVEEKEVVKDCKSSQDIKESSQNSRHNTVSHTNTQKQANAVSSQAKTQQGKTEMKEIVKDCKSSQDIKESSQNSRLNTVSHTNSQKQANAVLSQAKTQQGKTGEKEIVKDYKESQNVKESSQTSRHNTVSHTNTQKQANTALLQAKSQKGKVGEEEVLSEGNVRYPNVKESSQTSTTTSKLDTSPITSHSQSPPPQPHTTESTSPSPPPPPPSSSSPSSRSPSPIASSLSSSVERGDHKPTNTAIKRSSNTAETEITLPPPPSLPPSPSPSPAPPPAATVVGVSVPNGEQSTGNQPQTPSSTGSNPTSAATSVNACTDHHSRTSPSSIAAEEAGETCRGTDRRADRINTSILGPMEVRKGLAESINERNATIYKYNTRHVPMRRPTKPAKTIHDTQHEGTVEVISRDTDNLDAKEGEETHVHKHQQEDGEEEEEVEEEVEEKEEHTHMPEPYNPYVEYVVSEVDLPLVARLLRNVEPNLLWTWNRDNISFKHLSREQVVNRFPNTPFTTKYGLCETLQQLHWFSEAAGVDTFVPRGYCIGHEDERSAFIHDYRLTACLNMLKWFTERHETHGPAAVADSHGEVPIKRMRQALGHVEQYIQSCCHDDLDSPPPPSLREHEWVSLLLAHNKVVHSDRKVKVATPNQLQVLVRECESALERVVPFWPQLAMDGVRNIWIVKPGAQSRGRGIFLMSNLEEILALVQSPLIYETKYVVQKYMERPMLIHNTKFDIRQWFLVTDWNPLHVWVYRECYLRFCSQQFDLTNNNEAIHLSNNAIQCKYLNGERSGELPDENMWDLHQFKDYLRCVKKEVKWSEVIYPGMRDALVAAMLAAQVEMDSFKHGFELFGADFMLTEDLRPWLIEINSSPCMAATTSVTKRMCAQCLQDVVKVVVDYRNNKGADTGLFELAYRDNERSVPNPPYLGVNLQVVGRQIKKGTLRPSEKRKIKKPKQTERQMKPISLITLSLEEGPNNTLHAHREPQRDQHHHHHHQQQQQHGIITKHCAILDCRKYGGIATNSIYKEEEKEKERQLNMEGSELKGEMTYLSV